MATREERQVQQINKMNFENLLLAYSNQCCLVKCFKRLSHSFTIFTTGRNRLLVYVKFFTIIFQFCYGIFDQFTDWFYYFRKKSEDKFAAKAIANTMLFFLLADIGVHIIAWALILAQLKLNFRKDQILIDVNDQCKNETNLIKYLYKFTWKTAYNYIVIFGYSMFFLVHAVILTFLQLTKMIPYLLHSYFAYHYKIVLTRKLMEFLHLEQQQRKMNDEQRKRIRRTEEIMKMKRYQKKVSRINKNQVANTHQGQASHKQDKQQLRSRLSEMHPFKKQIADRAAQEQLLKAKQTFSISLDANMEPNLQTFFYEGTPYQKALRLAFDLPPAACPTHTHKLPSTTNNRAQQISDSDAVLSCVFVAAVKITGPIPKKFQPAAS